MPSPDIESVSWLRFIFASVTVLGLMALLAWALKYFSMRGWLQPRAGEASMKVLANLPLDARRRLVIAKCDDIEYHLLLGPNNDLVLSSKPASSSPKPSETNSCP